MRRHLILLFCFALTALQADPPTMFPAVRGTHEMVAAANNFQVEAGWRILMAGGNAVDAGVAAVLAATVTEQSRLGLGGEMPLLIKMSKSPATVISGVGVAPKLATVKAFTDRKADEWEHEDPIVPIPAIGIKSAITPGLFDGLILALRRYGTKSFAEVAKPAIELASGFPIADESRQFIVTFQDTLRYWPESKALFLPGDEPPKKGQVFVSADLAKTLQALVDAESKAKGDRAAKLVAVRDYFYKGPVAKKISRFSEANGGYLRYDDLANYHAEEDTPRTIEFDGYTIVKPGFWTQGPVMLEALQLLKGYDLKKMHHNSAEYVHTLLEAIKLAFADRDAHYGDPKFSKIPEQWLLSDAYADQRRKLIDPERASMESRPGQAPATSQASGQPSVAAHDTTCVNIVDRWGNAFTATPSGAWLPSVIAGTTGVPLSTRLQSFVLTPGHPNLLEAGKRPRVTLSPTMVLKDGQYVLGMSTPGGDNQDQAMLQVLLNILVFHMPPQEAVEAPRFQTEHFYASFSGHEFVPGKVNVENRFSREVIEELQRRGHKVNVTSPWSNGSAPTVIYRHDGILDGAADPRRNRYLLAR